MTRPKGPGRQIIIDLSFGPYSVNNVTVRNQYDSTPSDLKLSLDVLVPELERLGSDVLHFKVDISRVFRNVQVLGDAIHLGIRLVIYYSQSITITITFENIQSITITIIF